MDAMGYIFSEVTMERPTSSIFHVTAAVTQRFTTCPNTRCTESSGQQIYTENGEDIQNFIAGTRPNKWFNGEFCMILDDFGSAVTQFTPVGNTRHCVVKQLDDDRRSLHFINYSTCLIWH